MAVKRRFRTGQWVKLKSGKRAKVIGSAIYGYKTRFERVEYRVRPEGSKKTVYRREDELRKA
tara:strand:+ start:683 stop:868 length:186 start_codon:yes stop_codon:yes gene_type:complete